MCCSFVFPWNKQNYNKKQIKYNPETSAARKTVCVCVVLCVFTFPWKKQKLNKKSTNTIKPNSEPALFFVYYFCLQSWLVALYFFDIILFP